MKQESAPCVWLTGLSGAGKSTLAQALQKRLAEYMRHAVILDGDNLRSGLCSDLGFSLADRQENLRRTCEVAKLFAQEGIIPIVACITPLERDRKSARKCFPAGQFLLIFVDTPLSVCETRDVKGLYARARAGNIAEFTGISSPYEQPTQVDLRINAHDTIESSVEKILYFLI